VNYELSVNLKTSNAIPADDFDHGRSCAEAACLRRWQRVWFFPSESDDDIHNSAGHWTPPTKDVIPSRKMPLHSLWILVFTK